MTRTLKRVVEGGLKLRLVRALVVFGIFLLLFSWVIDYVARNELRAIREVIDADLSVGTVAISPFGHVAINDLVLSRDGKKFFDCKRIEMPFSISSRTFAVKIGKTQFISPSLHIFRKADGKLNVDNLFKPSQKPSQPFIPKILVTGGKVTLQETGFPSPLNFSEVQIDLNNLGKSFKLEVLGSAAWQGKDLLCRHFGLRGRLKTFEDLQLRFLLRDVHGDQVPSSWLSGGKLSGSVDAKGKLERLWGTTVVVGEFETNELHLKPRSGSYYFPTSFLDYKCFFAFQQGKQSLRSHPFLPDGGGAALDVTTRQGFINVCMDESNKCLLFKAPSFNMTKTKKVLSFANIHGALLGSELAGDIKIQISKEPTFLANFSLNGLDAKQLANVMPFPNFSLAGSIDLAGKVQGTFDKPTLTTKALSPDLKVFIGSKERNVIFHANQLRAQAKYNGRLITLKDLSCRVLNKTEVSVNGHYVPESGEDISLELNLKNVDFDDVEKILGGAKHMPPLPLRPLNPVDVMARLYATQQGPQANIAVKGMSNVLKIQNKPIHTETFSIKASMGLPKGKLPESLNANAVLTLKDKGSISATGVVPLVTTGPLDLSATVSEVDLGLLASFAPLSIATGTGKVSAKVQIEGRDEGTVHVVKANFKVTENAKISIPLNDTNGQKTLDLGVKNLKGNARLARSKDGLELNVSDLVSSLSRGGRLSLSADYSKSTTGEDLQAGFKVTKAELGELLALFNVNAVDAIGRGELAGSYSSSSTTKTMQFNFDFPKTTIIKKNGNFTYELPIQEFQGRANYLQTTSETHFHVPAASAKLLGGTLSISGSNQLEPVVKPNVRFVMNDIELKSLCTTLGLDDFSARGAVRVEGLLAGNIWWPRISARVISAAPKLYWRLDEDSKYPLSLGKTTGRVEFKRDKKGFRLDFKDVATTALDGSLASKGTFRLTPKAHLDLEFLMARATAKKLAVLLGIDDFSFAGTLNAQAKLVGAAKNPKLTAKLRLDDARLFYKLKGVNIFYHPPHVLGHLSLDRSHLELSDVRGPIHDGSFKFRIHRQRRDDVLWNASLHFSDVSLHSLFSSNLKQNNNIVGKGFMDLFFQGKGSDTKTYAGRGNFRVENGAIKELEELTRIEKEYKLRNLVGLSFETIESKVKLFKERLEFAEAKVRSSKGHAKGNVSVGFDRTLDGSLKVGLERNVLSSGHRLLSMLEGGKYFDFRVKVGGNIDKPDYKFSARGVQRGVFLGGALLFSPIAPAAAIIGGLQTLFGGKRRRRRPKEPAAKASPVTSAP